MIGVPHELCKPLQMVDKTASCPVRANCIITKIGVISIELRGAQFLGVSQGSRIMDRFSLAIHKNESARLIKRPISGFIAFIFVFSA